MTPLVPLCTHVCSSPGPESWGGHEPSPCIKDPHLFPSVPPFLQAWDSYREGYRKVSHVLPRATLPPAPCPWLPSSDGGQGRKKPWDVTTLPRSRAGQG